MSTVALFLPIAILAFLASTLVFDVVHWLLHRFAESRRPMLRRLGDLHLTHHRFLDRNLCVHPEEIANNLRRHVVPEYLTQLATSAALLFVLPTPPVLLCAAMQTGLFLWILRERGMDVNHRGFDVLPAYRPHYFCLPEYHALHHVHPQCHYSSWIKTLDHALGTGAQIRGRQVLLTGGGHAFAEALARRLEVAGAELEVVRDGGAAWLARQGTAARLRALDVLILTHGLGGAPASDYVRWIERFCAASAGRKLPAEVWATGSTRELDDDAGGGFLRHARAYLHDPRVIYRQLLLPDERSVASALDLNAARLLARRALRGARRGQSYIPLGPRAALAFPRFRALEPAEATRSRVPS